MPLYTILLAMGNPTVHYFSLDIEGAEFLVLQTIPWDKVRFLEECHNSIYCHQVDIRVLTVETHLAGHVFPGERSDIIAFMEKVVLSSITIVLFHSHPWSYR